MSVALSEMATESSAVQSRNALEPIACTLSPITIVAKLEQFRKAELSMIVTEFGIVTETNAAHLLYALGSIVVDVSGIVTCPDTSGVIAQRPMTVVTPALTAYKNKQKKIDIFEDTSCPRAHQCFYNCRFDPGVGASEQCTRNDDSVSFGSSSLYALDVNTSREIMIRIGPSGILIGHCPHTAIHPSIVLADVAMSCPHKHTFAY